MITQTPTAATMLARRLIARDFYAVALAKDVPTVHVNLSGANRAEIQILTDDETGESFYQGRIIIPGQNPLLFSRISHPRLVTMLETN